MSTIINTGSTTHTRSSFSTNMAQDRGQPSLFFMTYVALSLLWSYQQNHAIWSEWRVSKIHNCSSNFFSFDLLIRGWLRKKIMKQWKLNQCLGGWWREMCENITFLWMHVHTHTHTHAHTSISYATMTTKSKHFFEGDWCQFILRNRVSLMKLITFDYFKVVKKDTAIKKLNTNIA